MKVGLLTLKPSSNYGGILQAVALSHVLEEKGHEVFFLNKNRSLPKWKKIIFKALELIPGQNIKNKRKDKIKSDILAPFVKSNLPSRVRDIITVEDFQHVVNNDFLDSIVVGSDQVWRYRYINDGFYEVFFLPVGSASNVKKIAYAASFGKDSWEAPNEVENVKKLLRDFDFISVREDSGSRICSHVFDVDVDGVEVVVDPTLLVDTEFYNRFLNKKENVAKKYISTYLLDKTERKEKVVNFVKNSTVRDENQVIDLSEKKDFSYYTVEEWLQGLYDSSFVVTDSFHGMLFSVIFEKDFLVINNSKRGSSRFVSFLKAVGLECRIVDEDEELTSKFFSSINYDEVNNKLNYMRYNSRGFIDKALNDE